MAAAALAEAPSAACLREPPPGSLREPPADGREEPPPGSQHLPPADGLWESPTAPAAFRSAVRLYVTEDGPDWMPFDSGAADGEEPLSACPCREDRAWILNGIGALFGCGGDTLGKRRLLAAHGVASSTSGRGGRMREAALEMRPAPQQAFHRRPTV
mmetsp:Transcript_80038/g.212455  ORF Transcript_80038/g.212455 Transcript_80038/m.212455 type:complete len:157 (-) Transcript_80038:54-524(-)